MGREHRRGGGAGRGGSPRPGRPPPLPRIVSVLQILAQILEPPDSGRLRPARGGLAGGGVGAWHAVGFWGGAPWVRGPPSCRAGLLQALLPGFVRGRVLGGLVWCGWGVSGGLVVNCIVDASIKNVFCCFGSPPPWGPRLSSPFVRWSGGAGVGGRVCAARRVGWAGPSAVRAPVSDVRFVVVCCVLFVDF